MTSSILTTSGQFMSFLTIFGAGFVYILLGWILSSMMGDHADAHSGDTDGHDSDHNHETVSIFSPKVIAIFMVGFGAGGSIATTYALGVLTSTLCGLGVGFGFGQAGLWFMRMLYRQQSCSSIPTTAAIGQSATVSIDIPAQGVGEVALSVNGQHMTYTARLKDAIASRHRGSVVTVSAVQGTTLIVN